MDCGRGEIRGRESRQQIEAFDLNRERPLRNTGSSDQTFPFTKGSGSPVRGCPSTFPELLCQRNPRGRRTAVRYATILCAIAVPFSPTKFLCKMRDFQSTYGRLTQLMRNHLHIPETFFHAIQQNLPTRKQPEPIACFGYRPHMPHSARLC